MGQNTRRIRGSVEACACAAASTARIIVNPRSTPGDSASSAPNNRKEAQARLSDRLKSGPELYWLRARRCRRALRACAPLVAPERGEHGRGGASAAAHLKHTVVAGGVERSPRPMRRSATTVSAAAASKVVKVLLRIIRNIIGAARR